MRDYDYHNLNVYEADKMMSKSNPNKRWQPRSKSKWLMAAVIVVIGVAVLFGAGKLLSVLIEIARSTR